MGKHIVKTCATELDSHVNTVSVIMATKNTIYSNGFRAVWKPFRTVRIISNRFRTMLDRFRIALDLFRTVSHHSTPTSISKSTKSKNIPNRSKHFKNVSKMFQRISKGSKGSKMFQNVPKKLQTFNMSKMFKTAGKLRG